MILGLRRAILITILLTLLALYLAASISDGHEDVVRWNKTFGDGGSTSIFRGVAYGSRTINNDYNNGTIYAVGSAGAYNNGDWWLKKFFRNGSEDTSQWNLTRGYGTADTPEGVAVDSYGNVYVAGTATTGLDVFTDWWIKKFNSTGSENLSTRGGVEIWNKTFTGYDAADADDYARDIGIDSQDNIYVVGYLGTGAFLGPRVMVAKKFYYNGSEEVNLWNKTFIHSKNINSEAYALAIDSEDNVYVAGFGETLFNATSDYDWWIRRFNKTGTENISTRSGIQIWNKTFDFTGVRDIIFDLAVDSEDSLYAVGSAGTDGALFSQVDWWIKKFYKNGTEDVTLWNKTFTASNNTGQDEAYAVAVDENDNVYVGGKITHLDGDNVEPQWWIKKFNRSGTENTTSWNKTFGPLTGISTSVLQDIVAVDGNLTLVGSRDNAAIEDLWIKRLFTNYDDIKPGVNITDPIDGVIISSCNTNVSFNASVLEAHMGVVLFQLSNGTKPFNVTAVNFSGIWQALINMSRVFEESGGVATALANDTWNNRNFTETISYNLDCTAPSVSLSKTSSTGSSLTLSVGTSSDTQTCTTNQGSITGTGTSRTIIATGLAAETSYAFTVRCSDEAGNSQEVTQSFTTDAVSGDGGGSDGGSGSSSAAGDSTAADAVAAAESTAASSTESSAESGTTSSSDSASSSDDSDAIAGSAFFAQFQPVTIALTVNEPQQVTVGREEHIVTVLDAAEESVTILIQSEPVQLVLQRGQKTKVDTDGNGFPDLIVNYLGLENGQVLVEMEPLVSLTFIYILIAAVIIIIAAIAFISIHSIKRSKGRREKSKR
ncbi:MAG TPA: SBBP repeat-containing protein [Candidatus Nanoarchaeia archaeon]|nr:SBBP repeat-containing protein [Candidatus Nanoarchaeia archaeon]